MRLIAAARWLSTSQIQRAHFGTASADAVRKRLRCLTAEGYLVKVQRSRMEESLFRLGPKGRQLVEASIGREIVLERQVPRQLEHFLGLNDLRIAAEVNPALTYYFAAWDLPSLGWKHSIIPDAIFEIANQRFAVEFDRGEEGLQYFVRTKVDKYSQGLVGFSLSAVVVIADRQTRMDSLMKASGTKRIRMLFSTIERIRQQGMWGEMFYSSGFGQPLALLSDPLVDKRSNGG